MPIIRFGKLEETLKKAQQIINTGTKSQVYTLAKELSARAKARRTRALKAIENLPDYKIPTMYKQNKKRKTWLDEDFNVNTEMTIGHLRYKTKQLINYLSTQSSTIQGYNKIIADFKNRLVKGYEEQGIITSGEVLKARDIPNFWNIYNKVDELYNITPQIGESDIIQSYIARILVQGNTKGMDIDRIATMINNDLEMAELNSYDNVLSYGEHMDELYRIYESNYNQEGYEPLSFDEFKIQYEEGQIPNELLTSKFDF